MWGQIFEDPGPTILIGETLSHSHSVWGQINEDPGPTILIGETLSHSQVLS